MKANWKPQYGLPAALLGMVLGFSTMSQAQTPNYIVDRFDDGTGDSVLAYGKDYGPMAQTFEYDATQDAGGSTNAGSMKITMPFDLATLGGDNQGTLQRLLADVVDMTKYTTIHFDIKVDTNSSHLSGWGNGDFGAVRPYARANWTDWNVGYETNSVNWVGAAAYTNWVHKAIPINFLNSTPEVMTNITRFGAQIWSGWAGVGHTNTVVFWLDNIYFEGNTNTAPPPPPTLALDKNVKPKLNLFASGFGQYDRQSIRTVSNLGYSWVGATTSVTYSVTINSYPPTGYSNYQTHIFLVPGSPTGSAPDWDATNVVWFDIRKNADDTAYAAFRLKTNQPGGNTMFFNGEATNGPVGNLGTVGSSTVLGTWKLTFNNDTNVTITSPDSNSISLVLAPDVPPLFAEPLTVYFGAMPNEVANIGKLVVLGGVKIENGPTTVIEDDFAAPPLDELKWALAGADNPGIVLVPSDAAFWLSWTLPDLGFTLQASTNVAGPYVDSALSAVQFGGKRRVIVPTGVPSSASGYFRLLKP